MPGSVLDKSLRLARGILQPPRCLACEGFLEPEEAFQSLTFASKDTSLATWFCAACLPGVHKVVAGRSCSLCALPEMDFLDLEGERGEVCGACTEDPPPWRVARAAVEFGGPVRDAVKLWKSEGRRVSSRGLGALLVRALMEQPLGIKGPLCWVPMPLSESRWLERGFNQSEDLALALQDAFGGSVVPLLKRRDGGVMQKTLSRKERAENLKGLFVADASQKPKGKIVIVDDVLTTGATLREAAKAVGSVEAVVVLARTL